MPSYISLIKPNETDFDVSSPASLRYTRMGLPAAAAFMCGALLALFEVHRIIA
jgi:hypothetical protein